MLYKFLLAEAQKHFDARKKLVASLKTSDEIHNRQADLKAKALQAIGGFPDKTPLNAQVVGTLKGDCSAPLKVIYESRPNHHVTLEPLSPRRQRTSARRPRSVRP
jgi:hypothetical protein